MTVSTHQPRKRFGQNFLHDQAVLARMVQSVNPQPGERLVEIGPGQGALTCPILDLHGHLTAIELDRDLIPLLSEKCAPIGELTLIEADAMKYDFSALASVTGKIRLFGNLPYNISTPILFHLSEYAGVITDLHVLLQKEVAERIAATPGNKNYGRLSVMMQTRFDTTLLFDVGPGAFRPPPKVTSTFLRLKPHAKPVVHISDPDQFAALVTSAFSQRRKTLRNSIRHLLSIEQISAGGIDPSRRAETLTLEEFAILGNMLESSNTRKTPPEK